VISDMKGTAYRAVRMLEVGRPLAEQMLAAPVPGAQDVVVRVKAAGICHSDAHYRAGRAPARVPCTLGHEVAGTVAAAGAGVTDVGVGDRVCLHYLVTCGECRHCQDGEEQFCASGEMIGKHRDGGYAELIRVPARNAHPLPEAIPFEQGAILMCSSATALHALRKARLARGESVAVFGIGGLGVSAIQLARAFGAREVYAVDIDAGKLAFAEQYGAVPVNARGADPVHAIRQHTAGRGVDVALELIGLPLTMQQAIEVLAVRGRAALAGLTDQRISLSPYRDILNKEAEIIGVSDHLASELPELLSLVASGTLDLSRVVTRTLPLEAQAINGVLDALETPRGDIRCVIRP
jgi:propanol-preferring alcohol dehydrogenase